MKDIENRSDIKDLVDKFYKKAIVDSTIGFFFTDVAKMDWDSHIPIMYDFWEGVLFSNGSYKGNPMKPHLDLHAKSPMKHEHFTHWIKLFNETVDELFEGQKAEVAKMRALSIATVMELKIGTFKKTKI